MEKRVGLMYSALFLLMVSSVLVSAYQFPINDLKETGRNIIQAGKDVTTPFLEFLLDVNQFDENFFSRVLLLILLYSVIYIILLRVEVFRGKKNIIILVASIVSVLGTRYMSSTQIIQAVLLPYGTIAIAITFFLPFVIYFWFVFDSVNTSTGRRLAWILFGLVFIALWISRGDDIGSAGWVYTVGIILVLLCLIFDSAIRRYFAMHEINASFRHIGDANIVKMLEDYQRAKGMFEATGHKSARNERDRLARQLKINADTGAGNVGGLGI